MKNTEYEYSFKVKDLQPFLSYCTQNQYEKIEENKQTRILYKRDDQTMARITLKEKNGKVSKLLDFKDDNMSEDVLIIRRETLPIPFEDEEAVQSILTFQNYKKEKTLERIRTVYQKGTVIFELDHYSAPEEMFVVAVEGDKEQVDKVYHEIEYLNENSK